MVFIIPLTTLVLLSTFFIVASAATIQKPFLMLPKEADKNRQAVKDMFLYSYDAYKFVLTCGPAVANPNGYHRKYAWCHDDVTPISQSFSDERNGWGASVIDSLSTMVREFLPLLLVRLLLVEYCVSQHIMGLKVRGGDLCYGVLN